MMTAPGAQVDLYDAITTRFTSGAIGTVSGTGTVPTHRPFQVDIRFFGTEGMLLLDAERARMELRRHNGIDEVADVAPDAGGYECSGPPNNFVDLILGITDVNWSPGGSRYARRRAAGRSLSLRHVRRSRSSIAQLASSRHIALNPACPDLSGILSKRRVLSIIREYLKFS